MSSSFDDQIERLSTSDLERRIAGIDKKLERLSHKTLRSGVGSVGGRSSLGPASERSEWFQIELLDPTQIDQVVLVPTIWRDAKTGLRADGFPLEFKVIVGSETDTIGTVVASYSQSDRFLPRLAPLVVPCKSVEGSWVKIEATKLSPRVWDAQCVFQLSEILVFSGEENVALRRKVASSPNAFQKKYLVDGLVPYLMHADDGESSIAFVEQRGIVKLPELTIDLGSNQPVDRIHLHAVDLSDTVPQSNKDGYGMPRRILVEGATASDFSDAATLINFKLGTVYDFGPIVMRRFAAHSCRYVRITALEPDVVQRGEDVAARIGFAEIEVFALGKNVAIGKPIQANFEVTSPGRSLSVVTDGHNFYGRILPVRQWFNELAQRHDLEVQRPVLVAELNRKYVIQSSRLIWVTWLSVLLAFGIGVTIAVDRFLRMRELAKMKERIAADLHDELGANLHVIGMLGDLAKDATDSPDKLQDLHQRIRVMTERSGAAVRCCTNLLEAKDLYQDLYEDMERTTQRVMADMDGEFLFHGDRTNLKRLKPRILADLLLFYKECLVNISRHSEATKFAATLSVTENELCLEVSDNGLGLLPFEDRVPPSLLRRAKLLGARVEAAESSNGGTLVKLRLKTRKWTRQS